MGGIIGGIIACGIGGIAGGLCPTGGNPIGGNGGGSPGGGIKGGGIRGGAVGKTTDCPGGAVPESGADFF